MTDVPLFAISLLVLLAATAWLLNPTLSGGDLGTDGGPNEEGLDR